jgi:hypothetical protein
LTHERIGENQYLYDAVLTSGTHVYDVVYKREHLGGKWWLQIRHSKGLSLRLRAGEELATLTQADARELIGMLLEAVRLDHEGRLDDIQIDVQSIESLQASGVAYLREAKIPPKHDLVMSRLLYSAVTNWLQEEDLVEFICADLTFIQKKCEQESVGMNELAFRHELRLKHWEDTLAIPDLGVAWESVWFGINFQSAGPH